MFGSSSSPYTFSAEMNSSEEIITQPVPTLPVTSEITVTQLSQDVVNRRCFKLSHYGTHFQTFNLVLNIYILVPVVIIGVLANCLAFVALGRMRTDSPHVSIGLRALACADSTFLLGMLLSSTGRTIYSTFESAKRTMPYFPYVAVAAWPVTNFAQNAAVWLVCLVTVDRYLAVCHPLHSKLILPTGRLRWAIALVFALSLTFNIVTAFDTTVVDHSNICANETSLRVSMTPLLFNPHYNLVYKTILVLTFRTVGPVLLLLVLNIRLGNTIRESARRHHHEPGNALVLIVSVVSVFILCNLPDLVFRVIRTAFFYSNVRDDRATIFFAWFGQFSNFSLIINSAINFVIYYLSGSRFREALHRLFRSSRLCCTESVAERGRMD